jgi:UDP:flavonoid glycosyltransferase YjiC (YdhE family)
VSSRTVANLRGAEPITVLPMRVLFTTIPASGHFSPLIPLAHALDAAGHDVAVATAESFGDAVRRARIDHVPAGVDSREVGRLMADRPELRAMPKQELIRWLVVEAFANIYASALLADRQRLLDWQPDLVVREEGEFAGPAIAALAGVPWVDHSWGPMRPSTAIDDVVPQLAQLWERHGLLPDPRAGFYRWLYLDVAPPTLQFPYAAKVANRRAIRSISAPPSAKLPSWLSTLGRRPCIYVTLGTSLQASDRDFFRIVMSALEHEDTDVVVTVGPSEPTALEPTPRNVRVEHFIPQDALMPFCAAVVSNGGAGSTMGALAAGVPLLIVPAIAASQTRNAQAVVRCGAGRTIDRDGISRDVIHREVRVLLDDPSYAQVARTIADEIAAMPEPAELVPALESLSDRRQATG